MSVVGRSKSSIVFLTPTSLAGQEAKDGRGDTRAYPFTVKVDVAGARPGSRGRDGTDFPASRGMEIGSVLGLGVSKLIILNVPLVMMGTHHYAGEAWEPTLNPSLPGSEVSSSQADVKWILVAVLTVRPRGGVWRVRSFLSSASLVTYPLCFIYACSAYPNDRVSSPDSTLTARIFHIDLLSVFRPRRHHKGRPRFLDHVVLCSLEIPYRS